MRPDPIRPLRIDARQRGGFLWDLTAPPDAEPLRLRDPGIRVMGWHSTREQLARDGCRPLGLAVVPGPPPIPRFFGDTRRCIKMSASVLTASDWSPPRRTVRFGYGLSPAALESDPGSCIRLRESERSVAARDGAGRVFCGGRVKNGQRPGPSARWRTRPRAARLHRRHHRTGRGASVAPRGCRGRRVHSKGGAVRVWDLESEEVRVLDAGDGEAIERLEFYGRW